MIVSAILLFQVVLEGLWPEGFMAIAAIGATNIGSIKVEWLFADYTTHQEIMRCTF